jgi:FkbM family methyltransferase
MMAGSCCPRPSLRLSLPSGASGRLDGDLRNNSSDNWSDRCGLWGVRAPTRCITVPQGANEGSTEGGVLKLSAARRSRAGHFFMSPDKNLDCRHIDVRFSDPDGGTGDLRGGHSMCASGASRSVSREALLNIIELKTSDGLSLAVPATLKSITTYVLLEQEAWFEKEMSFVRQWLQPGMTAIDIGANLGVYSLLMSRLVGPSGHVFAYEPGSEAGSFLHRSRDINKADNLKILAKALSDRKRTGRLLFGHSSELNTLGEVGSGETVDITSLDDEDAVRDWSPPDFVKIDAEGEEERILTGARHFLTRYSPLIMFEIKAGTQTNERLRALFPAIGFRLFRQLAGAPILVPDFPQQPLDGYELNLFAAKQDRVHLLSKQGVLVETFPAWVPTEEDCIYGDLFWKDQVFGSIIGSRDGNRTPADPNYRKALAAFATWRASARPTAVRCAALAFALRNLRAICKHNPTPARLSTWARVAWESGARAESVTVLQRILQGKALGQPKLDEPFWPAAPRFDTIAPSTEPTSWFAGALAEQYERTFAFSSAFSGASPHLNWLCAQTFASAEMERRRALSTARTGLRPAIPTRLHVTAADHLNAEIWRTGRLPSS